MEQWPRVIVVTDRHRLVRHVNARPEDALDLLQAQVLGAIRGGADLVQVREADLEPGLLVRFLRRLFDAAPHVAPHTVVNDRCDVALVTSAGGVHLGERSVGVAEVRQLAPAGRRWIVGQSVHDPRRAEAAREADYLIAGTVRPSESKPTGWSMLGWPGLAAITRAAAPVPVVAIGGLGPQDVGALRAAGATGLAGIGCFLPRAGAAAGVEAGTEARVRELRQALVNVS